MKRVIFILLSCIIASLNAQNFNQNFFLQHSMSKNNSSKLFLQFNNTNFIKNDEYFGNLIKGYTYIGFFAQPALVFYPHHNIKVTAGAHILKYSGLNTFSDILPIFSIQFSPAKGYNFIMGTLYGNLNHKIIEPLFDFERYFTNNVENGAQILLNNRWLQTDIWVDWEHFIFRTGNDQEHIIGGANIDIILTKPSAVSQFSIPFQAIVAHKGGQYHLPFQHLQTIINTAIGIKYERRFTNKFINSIGIHNYFITYKDASSYYRFPYIKGHAFNSNVFVKTKYLQLWLGYWQGNHFISSLGNPLFMSVSSEKPDFVLPKSELITGKFSINKKIYNDVMLEARFESYYDTQQSRFEYAYSLYIVFNKHFFLTKIK